MGKLRAYTGYENGVHYYKDFSIVEDISTDIKSLDELIANKKLTSWMDNDQCIKINEIELDTEQGNSDVYNYDFYEVVYVDIADYHEDDDENKNIDDYIKYEYLAVKCTDETEEYIEG